MNNSNKNFDNAIKTVFKRNNFKSFCFMFIEKIIILFINRQTSNHSHLRTCGLYLLSMAYNAVK